MSSSVALEWKFSQVFGEKFPGEKVDDVDLISVVEFESRGDYLATGDHGGRVVLFKRIDGKNLHPRKELEHMDHPATVHPRYFYKTEFQSHELEFDYLKSLEIGEKINKLRFCATPNNSLFILFTNDRTIKLWKVTVMLHRQNTLSKEYCIVSECKVKRVKEMELSPNVSSENALLSEKSFVIGLNESSVQNGNHLEWINKKPRSVCPTPEEGPNMLDKEFFEATWAQEPPATSLQSE